MGLVKQPDNRNPWLDIPAGDYVGHMSTPEVAQSEVLNRVLRNSLRRTRPLRVLVLGGSAGNGLEHVGPAVTSHVIGIAQLAHADGVK